ncbi:MAG: type II restriction endonuclease [Dehalococcoidia bacterium]
MLLQWLRDACAAYVFNVAALYKREGDHDWPLEARDAAELERQLGDGGHFLPLPKEPAALANVLEVSVVDYILERADATPGIEARRGTERGYPDIEFSGDTLDGGFYAVDVKVARRHKSGRRTQSRITLYTGNTYFRYPSLHWPGTFRPFQDYAQHLDVICIYDLSPTARARVANLELIVQEAWRIGSKQRSSTTREYIGAVNNLDALREGRGEFASAEDFYRFWRRYNFRIGRTVQLQLDRLLEAAAQRERDEAERRLEQG